METKWLEDFVSIAETRSFSKSAAQRNVTQPAFSRRIQALESWVGTDLIDRTSYPTKLTRAGEVFYEQSLEMLVQINGARSLLRGQQPSAKSVIDFAVPHTLSLTFFPRWLAGVEDGFGRIPSRLMAMNVHDAALQLVEGGCDLLMCYHHPRQPVQLDPARYEMILLGTEALYPYSPCDAKGVALYELPGTANAPLPFLSYGSNAFFGRMVELIMEECGVPLHLDSLFETDMAEGLKVMALERHGLAFLPESAVSREIRARQLARADGALVRGIAGGAANSPFSVTMDVRLYRERRDAKKPVKQAVERLWRYLSENVAEHSSSKPVAKPRTRRSASSTKPPARVRQAP